MRHRNQWSMAKWKHDQANPKPPGFEADINKLIDEFVKQAQAGPGPSLELFKTIWQDRLFSFIHLGCPHHMMVSEYLQLLFSTALNRFTHPSPFAPKFLLPAPLGDQDQLHPHPAYRYLTDADLGIIQAPESSNLPLSGAAMDPTNNQLELDLLDMLDHLEHFPAAQGHVAMGPLGPGEKRGEHYTGRAGTTEHTHFPGGGRGEQYTGEAGTTGHNHNHHSPNESHEAACSLQTLQTTGHTGPLHSHDQHHNPHHLHDPHAFDNIHPLDDPHHLHDPHDPHPHHAHDLHSLDEPQHLQALHPLNDLPPLDDFGLEFPLGSSPGHQTDTLGCGIGGGAFGAAAGPGMHGRGPDHPLEVDTGVLPPPIHPDLPNSAPDQPYPYPHTEHAVGGANGEVNPGAIGFGLSNSAPDHPAYPHTEHAVGGAHGEVDPGDIGFGLSNSAYDQSAYPYAQQEAEAVHAGVQIHADVHKGVPSPGGVHPGVLDFGLCPSAQEQTAHPPTQEEVQAASPHSSASFQSLLARIGALYCLYCLYETQHNQPRVNVYLPLPVLDIMTAMLVELRHGGFIQALKIMQYLWKQQVFLIGATSRPPHGVWRPRYSPLSREAAAIRSNALSFNPALMENKGMRDSLLHLRSNLQSLMDYSKLRHMCKDYNETRQRIFTSTGSTGSGAAPPAIFDPSFADDLEGMVSSEADLVMSALLPLLNPLKRPRQEKGSDSDKKKKKKKKKKKMKKKKDRWQYWDLTGEGNTTNTEHRTPTPITNTNTNPTTGSASPKKKKKKKKEKKGTGSMAVLGLDRRRREEQSRLAGMWLAAHGSLIDNELADELAEEEGRGEEGQGAEGRGGAAAGGRVEERKSCLREEGRGEGGWGGSALVEDEDYDDDMPTLGGGASEVAAVRRQATTPGNAPPDDDMPTLGGGAFEVAAVRRKATAPGNAPPSGLRPANVVPARPEDALSSLEAELLAGIYKTCNDIHGAVTTGLDPGTGTGAGTGTGTDPVPAELNARPATAPPPAPTTAKTGGRGWGTVAGMGLAETSEPSHSTPSKNQQNGESSFVSSGGEDALSRLEAELLAGIYKTCNDIDGAIDTGAPP
eukprot:gene21650-28663_t